MGNFSKKIVSKINIWYVVFSALFASMLIASRHVFYDHNAVATIKNIYVSDFHFLDVISLLLFTPMIYIGLEVITFFLKSSETVFFQKKRKPNIGIWIGFFLFLMVVWLPYLPSYWPGGIYSDTVDSINMALGKKEWDNHNPLLYTLIWRFMFWVTGAFQGAGEYGGLKLFTVVQTSALALTLSGFWYWCYKKGIHKAVIILGLLIMGMYPLYPFYGISLWKDTPFSIVLFLLSVFLYQLFEKEKKDISLKNLGWYSFLTGLVIFLRNNGIYIAVFYSVIITLYCWKKKKQLAKKIGLASLVIIMTARIIQGPVYDSLGYNIDTSKESMGIPMQQVAYILATEGEVLEEKLAVLEYIMPLENWITLYNPVVGDTIKFDPSFNQEYFEKHSGEFFKVYVSMVMRNPIKAAKAYLLETMGFWDISKSSSTAYICNFHFGNAEYFMSDYFDYYLDISFRKYVEPKNYLSAALFAWFMLGTGFLCLAKKNIRGIICILPTLGLWLSIMVAVPVAFSFRYIYSLFLCVPLYLIVCVESFHKPKIESIKHIE